MTKRDLALLEKIFSNDVERAIQKRPYMPTQIAGKRIEELARQGYVRCVEIALPGRPKLVVRGWE